jgi:hypothetical protein
VTQPTREIGIRVAFGAERFSVLKLVVGQGFRPAAAGVAMGVTAVALAGRSLGARRAVRVDPAATFRSE